MRILFIRYKKSKSILEGGEQCSTKNHNVLASIVGDDNIDTYYIHEETRKRNKWEYVSGCWYFLQHYYFGLSPQRVKTIVAMAKEYDAVWIDRSLFGIIAKQLKENRYPGRILGFFHNVEQMYFDAKLNPKLPFRNIVLNCADINDRYACQYCDKIVTLNQRDDDELASRYGRRANELVPIAFEDKYNLDTYPTEQTASMPLCLIVGSYFPANVEGIEWFVKNVLPHVDIRLRIVGKGMEKLQNESWMMPTIELIPNAPDLKSHFEEADMMVLPIFKGGGMKVKTCESLMYGKNILGTDEAWEGYQIDKVKAGGLCNSADDFIDRIKEIQKSPIPRFNTYSRQVFVQNYTTEAIRQQFLKLLE